MTPYYQDDHATIYHGDCLELFHLWDLAAAVMVTDPPYGMSYVSNASKYGKSDPIASDDTTEIRDEILRRWGDRPALVFGTWRRERPSNTKQLIVWDRGMSPGMGDLKIPWGNTHEEVYVLGTGFVGKRGRSIIAHDGISATSADRPNHPTPKPVELMRDLIAKCPPLAEIVDPFMGSGTTLRAAKDLGRKSIGIELEERYCEIAAKRLAQEVMDFGAA